MTWFWFALQNARRNRRRALLTLLIAGVGTAALLVFGGYGEYTYAALRNAAARDTGHLLLAQRHYFDGEEDVPMQNGLEDSSRLQTELRGDPRVKAALPRLQLTGLLSNGEKSAVFVGTGVDAALEAGARGDYLSIQAGSPLSPSPGTGDLPEILLGRQLSKALNAPPGSVLTLLATTTEGSLNAQDVRVRGVYTTGVLELDRRAVTLHLSTAEKLLLTGRVSTLSVYLRSMDDLAPVEAELKARYPALALRTWLEEATYYQAVRDLYDRIFGLLGMIIVVLVLFAVTNTIGMAVVERTREIGTFRALGAMPGTVTRSFVLEGVLVGGGGVVLGAFLATLIAVAIDAFHVQMPPPPGRSVGYPLHLSLGPALYLRAGLSVVLSAALAAYGASRKAAARPIVEALAHV